MFSRCLLRRNGFMMASPIIISAKAISTRSLSYNQSFEHVIKNTLSFGVKQNGSNMVPQMFVHPPYIHVAVGRSTTFSEATTVARLLRFDGTWDGLWRITIKVQEIQKMVLSCFLLQHLQVYICK